MVKNNIVIENARIGFRNFSGKEGKFNPAGRRNFCVFLETDIATRLQEDGWNIRWLDPKDEYDERQAYLQVTVRFESDPTKEKRNPNVIIISSRGKTKLNEDSISMMDWVEIEKVDLTIRPSNWEVNGKTGVKAYIKSMYVTVVEDELAAKYYDVPDSATDAIGGCGNCDACDGNGDCKNK